MEIPEEVQNQYGNAYNVQDPVLLAPRELKPTQSPVVRSPKKHNEYRESFINDEPVDPIIVEFNPEKGYLIRDGHHRWSAAMDEAVEKVPVILITPKLANLVPAEDLAFFMRYADEDQLAALRDALAEERFADAAALFYMVTGRDVMAKKIESEQTDLSYGVSDDPEKEKMDGLDKTKASPATTSLSDSDGPHPTGEKPVKMQLSAFVHEIQSNLKKNADGLTSITANKLDECYTRYLEARESEVKDYFRRNFHPIVAAQGRDWYERPLSDLLDLTDLFGDNLLQASKDAFWSDFIVEAFNATDQNWISAELAKQAMFELEAAPSSPKYDGRMIPEVELRDALRRLQNKQENGSITVEEQGELGALEAEEERRGGYAWDPDKKPKKASTLEQVMEEEDLPVDIPEVEKMVKSLAKALGEEEPAEIYSTPGLQIAANKSEDSWDLDADLFDDQNDYSHYERSLGALAVSHLDQERPRLQVDTSLLIRRAANQIQQDLRLIRGPYTIENLNLARIINEKVGQDATPLLGKIIWHARVASHRHRRVADVTLEMPVVDGHPQTVTTISTNKGTADFTREALDELMDLPARTTSGTRPAKVEQSFRE